MKRKFKGVEFEEKFAIGGTATLYKGTQLSLNRTVVVKELHPHMVANENFIKRFEREAEITGKLNHPNILHIIDWGKMEEKYLIIMEYIDGIALKELVSSVEVFPVDIAFYVVKEICKGIEFAHKEGVIHRDIKPGNVLISKDGMIKVADFGLARAVEDDVHLTTTGTLLGTPAYMSPEQAAGKTELDARTDIFSTGVMLFEMITGTKPFSGKTYTSVITNILTEEPKFVYDIDSSIPEPVGKIISKCLEKDVEKRYRSVSDLRSDIENYMNENKMFITEKNLVSLIKDPEQYKNKITSKKVKQHVNKGLYFMQMGKEKIVDALTEFELALQIDPQNQEVKQKIEKLKQQRENIQHEQKKRVTTKYKEKKTAKPQKGEQPKAKKKKSPAVLIFSIIVLLIIVVSLFGVVKFVLPKLKAVQARRQATVTVEEQGQLMINSMPPGANIFIDGVDTNKKTPSRVNASLGAHTIKLEKEGFRSFEQEFSFETTLKSTGTIQLEKQ